MEMFRRRRDRIRVHATVEVHGHLNGEDDGKDHPSLVPREAEAELVVAVVLGLFTLTVRPHLFGGPRSTAVAVQVSGIFSLGMCRLAMGSEVGFASEWHLLLHPWGSNPLSRRHGPPGEGLLAMYVQILEWELEDINTEYKSIMQWICQV